MNKRTSLLAAGLNVFFFVLLFIIVFFAFDIDYGITAAALTWGLPVVIASLFTLIAGIITWKKGLWKWGISGLGVAIASIVYIGILLFSFSHVILPPQTEIVENNLAPEETEILELLLSERFDDGGYAVINPYTVIPDIELEKVIKKSEEISDKYNYDFKFLIERYFEINEESERLSLISAPEKGYYIDYDGIFRSNTGSISDVSLRWILFHPQAKGYAEISLPAYDADAGYFLIYTRYKSSSLFHPGGDANLVVYQYKNGELTVIDYLAMWVN